MMTALPDGPSESGTVADPAQFRRPLDFLLAEHERLSAQCETLDSLVDDPLLPGSQHAAASILDYLENNYPGHITDEECLFALLRSRCPKGGEIDETISLLEEEHVADEKLLRGVVRGLKGIVAGQEPRLPVTFFANALAFIETQRRHMAWENTKLLPLARNLLTASELAELGQSMARRRGVEYPG
jgi:hemerythrin-like domain-containing protein